MTDFRDLHSQNVTILIQGVFVEEGLFYYVSYLVNLSLKADV